MPILKSSLKYIYCTRAFLNVNRHGHMFSTSGALWFKQSSLRSTEPVGVQAALRASKDSSYTPRPTLFSKEFSLDKRVAIVTGGQRGLGLEMASALAEAGATVYCLDRPAVQDADPTFHATKEYISRLGISEHARLEYASLDVTDQKSVWDTIEGIAGKEGRLDACVAAAGVIQAAECLDYSAKEFQALMDVNVNGVLFTAQAAGRQMVKLDNPGSIVLIASLYGSLAPRVCSILFSEISSSTTPPQNHSFPTRISAA